MKSVKFTFILFLAIISFAPVAETKAQSVNVSVNFNTFQQELSPYGRWMNDARYGQVWIYNDADFRPYYTDGHWEYTNYGWSWISDYDWGWAPFHYGRWEYDPYYGWMWIPGYEWASAWVSWSSVDDYYGWAPLGFGVSINVSFGAIPHDRWNFIPRRNICERNVYRYCEPYGRNNNFRNAVVINNYYNGRDGVGRYVRGPERREVERYTNNRIEERRVNYSDRNWSRGNGRNYGDNGRRDNNGYNRGNNNVNNGNGRRRNDVNDNPGRQADQQNRRPDNNNDNRPDWRRNNNGNQQNNGNGNDNNQRRREMNQNRDNNNTPPVIENRRPQREQSNTAPADQNYPVRRQNDNRWNRSNDQQNNDQQQRPQNERPAQPQRQQVERPAPQQQQQAPVMEQRRMERRPDNNNMYTPRSDGNQQRERGNNGRRRDG